MERDAVDEVVAQWRAERPELDVRAMAIVGRLGRVSALGERLVEATLRKHGLAIGDFDVLASLRRAGAPHRLTPTQLYTSSMITSGAMTNRLDRLEERGLIARLDDPSDRRGTLVALTDEGLALVNEAVEAHVANEARMLSVLTRAEQSQLDLLLRKLLAGFERALADAAGSDEPAPSSRPRGAAKSPRTAGARKASKRRR